MSAALKAKAALELRQQQASGSGVAALIKAYDGQGWCWRGGRIDDEQAAEVRRTFRGRLVVVTREPPAPVQWRAA